MQGMHGKQGGSGRVREGFPYKGYRARMRARTHDTCKPDNPAQPCTTLHYRNTSLLMSATPDQPIHPFPWVKEHAGNKREQAGTGGLAEA